MKQAFNPFVSVLAVSLAFISSGSQTQAQTIARGPYLQQGTPSSIVVRWRTSVATTSRVRYGTTPGNFTTIVSDPVSTTEHVVSVPGLQPLTRYYYEVGTGTAFFVGDANDFFETAPAGGTAVPTRIWVIGDSGTANASAAAVRDAYINFAGTRHTDVWLMLGDNAYNSGTDTEYQNAVFNMYPTILQNTTLWSTRGNHESDAGGSGSTYYNIFTLPRNAEAGGTASGTEAYYSFEYGNIHFICLDAFGSSRLATGPMATWLRNDLAAVTRDWIIAFWHHPPYSKGSHNSDTEIELIEMRQNVLPILEDGGVDLVLCGHSHCYERSFLLDGHYGTSGTLTAGMILNNGSGREDGTGVYIKSTFGAAPHEGAVYAVAGSSGQISGGTLDHPAMFISLNNLGSMVLDLNSNRLDAKFLRENGTIADYFTIRKGAVSPPAAPQNLVATPGNAQVSLTWNASSGATSYNVKRSTTSGGPYTTIANPTAASYLDTTVVNDTTYFYVVSALNASGESANSAQASATPSAPTPPPAPQNLVATPGNAQVSLTWNASSGAASYNVKRSTISGGPYTTVANPTATSYLDTTVVNGTTYFYVVSALNAVGESANSAQASATPTAPMPPAAPSNLTLSTTKRKIRLNWVDNSNNETGFKIERSTDGMNFTQVATVAANIVTYQNNGVTPGVLYYYRLRATNAAGDSAYSNTASIVAR